MSYASLSLAVASAAAIMMVPSLAHAADEAGSADWQKFYGAAVSVMRGKFASDSTAREASQQAARPDESRVGHTQTAGVGNGWFGVEPKVSLVARDWGEGYRLYGAPMALSDELRISRSTRMVMSRLRLGSGRITPFVQLGIGQWRIDTTALPAMRYAVEIATQTGFGLEAHLASHWDMVAETNSTYFLREHRDAQSVDSPRVFGAAIFSRLTF